MDRGRLDDLVEQVTAKATGRKSAGFPYVGLEHIEPGARRLMGVAPSSISESTNGVFARGDILFGKLRPNLRKAVQVECDGYCSTDFLVLRPKAGVHPRYASHVVASEGVFRHAERNSIGTGMPRTSWLAVSQAQVWVPPLEEQRQIAEVLDTIDETIQATERILSKLLGIEQGLRRDLLEGKFEGARSEDWARCRIGEFADVQRGASPRPIDNPAWFSVDGPGWVRISDVSAAGDVLLETRDHLSPAGVARSRRVHPGEVIMSIAATIGVAIVVGIEACYHDGFVKIDHDESVIPEFLVMLLAHHKDDFIRSGQTGTQANINSTIVAETEVQIPSLEVQAEIVSATSSLRAAIRVEEESIRALREIRDGLAADLLSGRVRTVAA